MAALAWIVLLLIVFGVLSFQRASLSVKTIAFGVYLLLVSFFSNLHPFWLTVIWLLYAVVFAPLNIFPLRRKWISDHVLKIFRQAMPKMSATEQEALSAGGVGWEADLFSGMPNWRKFKKINLINLTEEEKEFLQGPVETLCTMIDNWKISRSMQVPENIWSFIKKEGFLGIIIPKRYGGKEFSATAHGLIVSKVSGVSIAVSSIIAVPNSLGPAELLLMYGTQAQKNYYLPRLAAGDDIPCFALTSPVAGSDAGSIEDYGIVCRKKIEGEEKIGIRLTWNKRYITLAPVATLIGLAFKLYDPEHILSDKKEVGITCALIPAKTEGVIVGRRHYPLDAAFPNGPTQGKDVFITLDYIIGGKENVGKGWKMLMECLAAGRSISLPSMALGCAVRSMLASGAYCRIRTQFNTYIGQFGGVQEALARIGSFTYIAEALRLFTISQNDQGKKSAIASAISKYHTTELGRQVGKDAMDIHGGKGICMGPNNYLAQSYIEAPISITVEGANILTRSMIIFGQGAIRCHPYILTEMQAVLDHAKEKSLARFDRALFGHVGFLISNIVRSFLLGLTNAYIVFAPNNNLRRYYQQFSRFSAAFALIADATMLTIGAALKRKEKLSGRLGDVLSMLYMGSAVIKFYESATSKGPNEEELPVAKWACEYLLFRIQSQIDGLLANLPNRLLAWCLRGLVMPLGKRLKYPSDRLGAKVAHLLMEPNSFRQRFAKTVYYAPNENNPIGKLADALEIVIASEPLEKKLTAAERKGEVLGKNYEEIVSDALAKQVIAKHEADQLLKSYEARMSAIMVDDFAPEDLEKL